MKTAIAWHYRTTTSQNEAMPHASLRNSSQKGDKELCTSYLNLVASKRCWRLLVRVVRWGWDSAETLLPLTPPHDGVGGSRERGAFCLNFFFPLNKDVKTRVLTCIHIRLIYLALKTCSSLIEYRLGASTIDDYWRHHKKFFRVLKIKMNFFVIRQKIRYQQSYWSIQHVREAKRRTIAILFKKMTQKNWKTRAVSVGSWARLNQTQNWSWNYFKVRNHYFVSNLTNPINKMFVTLIYLTKIQLFSVSQLA